MILGKTKKNPFLWFFTLGLSLSASTVGAQEGGISGCLPATGSYATSVSSATFREGNLQDARDGAIDHVKAAADRESIALARAALACATGCQPVGDVAKTGQTGTPTISEEGCINYDREVAACRVYSPSLTEEQCKAEVDSLIEDNSANRCYAFASGTLTTSYVLQCVPVPVNPGE